MSVGGRIVDEPSELLKFLYDKYKHLPQKRVKQFLSHRAVIVDGRIITQFNYMLRAGQTVFIDTKGSYAFLDKNKIELIYEDSEIIVINKPYGLLSVASDDKSQNTAYKILTDYVRLDDKNNRIFIVHRLDRDTSGVLMAAKTEDIKKAFQDSWNEIVSQRLYYAVVEGRLPDKQGSITCYLKQDKNNMVYAANDGEKAITEYRVIKENGKFSLVDIAIKTGKKNQIRVAMKELGNPIAGDKKYGSAQKTMKRMGLHAYKLEVRHPITGKIMAFKTNMPKAFLSVLEAAKG